MTRSHLGELLGLPGPSISNRLRGKIKWTGEDIALTASALGVALTDLYPVRMDDGSWVPAQFVPGQQKAPAPAGAGAPSLVAGTGFEPATSGLRARPVTLIVLLEYVTFHLVRLVRRQARIVASHIEASLATIASLANPTGSATHASVANTASHAIPANRTGNAGVACHASNDFKKRARVSGWNESAVGSASYGGGS